MRVVVDKGFVQIESVTVFFFLANFPIEDIYHFQSKHHKCINKYAFISLRAEKRFDFNLVLRFRTSDRGRSGSLFISNKLPTMYIN